MQTNTPQTKDTLSESNVIHKDTRLSWLDQFRGILLIFLFISSLTWIFSANIRQLEVPIGPTWLNFGFKYVDFYPRMITLIDLGSEIFMTIIGISVALSFHRKMQEKGAVYTWISVMNRVFIFFWLAEIMETNYLEWALNDILIVSLWGALTTIAIILRYTVFKNPTQRKFLGVIWAFYSCISWIFKFDFDLWAVFFQHELALIAWGTLMGAVFYTLIKNPDYRIIVPIVLLIIHYILWVDFYSFSVSLFESTSYEMIVKIPFNLISMTIVSIIGTSIWSWMQIDPNDPRTGIKRRIIPLMVITCILHFIVDFFQPANNDGGLNVSLTLLTIAFGIFLMLCVYGLDKYVKYRAHFLVSVGSNGLFLFLLQAILTLPYIIIWPEGGDQFRTMVSEWLNVTKTSALVNFLGLIAFILPISILIGTALLLNKYKIRVKV